MNPKDLESIFQQSSENTVGDNANIPWDFESLGREVSESISNVNSTFSNDIEEEWAIGDDFDFENDQVLDAEMSSMVPKILSECVSIRLKIPTTQPSTVIQEASQILLDMPQSNQNLKIETPEEIMERIFKKDKQKTTSRWTFKAPDGLSPHAKNPAKTNDDEKIENPNILDNSRRYNDVQNHTELPKLPVRLGGCTPAEDSSLPTELQVQTRSGPINHNMFPNGIINSVIQIFNSLELGSEIQLSTIIHMILGHLKKHSNDSSEDQENAVRSLITPALLAITTYQEEMDAAFEQRVWFETENEYQEMEMASHIRSKINLTNLGPLNEVVEEKLNGINTFFKNLNEEILFKEKNTAIYVTQRINKFYDEKTTPSSKNCRNTAELKEVHETTLEFCKNAFIHGFGSPTSTLGSKALQDLCDTLHNKFSTAERKLNATLSPGFTRIKKAGNEYKPEMGQNLDASHFSSIQQTAVKHGTNENSKKINSVLQDIFQNDLQTPIEKMRTNCKQNFESQKPTDNTQVQTVVHFQVQSQHLQPKQETSESSALVPTVGGGGRHTLICVGIHFSLDKISAGIQKPDGAFEIVHGPEPNQISFYEEIIITNIPDGVKSTKIRKILTETNIEKSINVEINGTQLTLRVEEVLAYIFAQLHQILKGILHTNMISYAITYPSSYNKKIWTVLKDAITIAGIHAILIRESDTILCRRIFTKAVTPNCTMIVVAVEDDESKGSDIAIYEIYNGRLQLGKLFGYSPSSRYLGFSSSTGLEECVKHLSKKIHTSDNPKVFLYCMGPERKAANIKALCDSISSCKSVVPIRIQEVMEGAVVLSRFHYDAAFRSSWKNQFPFANFDNILKILPSDATHSHFQILHVGNNLPEPSIKGKSTGVQVRIRQQFDYVTSIKDKIRQEYLKIKDDLGSRPGGKKKDSLLDALDETIRKINNEHVSVRHINAEWNEILELVRDFRC